MEHLFNRRKKLHLKCVKTVASEHLEFSEWCIIEDQASYLSQTIEDIFQARKLSWSYGLTFSNILTKHGMIAL